MKRIILPFLLLLVLTACSNKQQASETTDAAATTPAPGAITAPAAATSADATATAASVDAITSATSKPNQVSFNGIIVLPPERLATVALTLGGVVRSTTLIPGQAIRKGALLATLENPEFIDLQQTYLESHAQTEYLRTEYDRQKTLADQQAASQKKLQQTRADYLAMKSRLEAAAAQLSLLNVEPTGLLTGGIQPLLQVKAPISGHVTRVAMNMGKYITPGEALCEIIDKSAPLLCLTTYEKDLARMQVGNPVQFRVNGMGTRTFQARILSIGQQVDPVNRSVEVYARILDADPQFRPGMYVAARID